MDYPIMENQLDKKMENEMEAGFISGSEENRVSPSEGCTR